jgi:pSer/pThr/pTyr-binding forkhead associated (FHA) protein
MKLSLVVAQGVHAGKVIPCTSAEFVIGRDPQCQLRPASPAISKQHCALSIRGGKAYVRDCGSTNGTFINGEQVAGEREVKSGDRLKVGPLEFDLRIETTASSPAPAAPAAAPAKPAAAPAKPAAKPAPKPAAKPTPSAAAVATDTVPDGATVIISPGAANTTVVEGTPGHPPDDPDHLAALLLGLDEPAGSGPTVESMSNDPTTVLEQPALAGTKPNEAAKKDEKKAIGDSASAAAEVLSKYMRRPRT